MVRSSIRTTCRISHATSSPLLVLALAAPLVSVDPVRPHQPPTPVSPGSALQELEIDQRCPVFTWTSEGLSSHALRLEVHRLSYRGRELVLSRRLPPHLLQLLPAGSDCLVAGQRYEWSLVSSLHGFEVARSQPSRFFLRRGPSEAELDAALAVLRSLGGQLPQRDSSAAGTASVRPPITARSRPARLQGLDRVAHERGRAARSRVESPSTSSGVSVAGDGTLTASSYVALFRPQSLTGVTAVDLACTGCVHGSHIDQAVLQTATFVDCGPDGWLRQLNTPVCEEDSPNELTEETILSPVDGRALVRVLGSRNPGFGLCALTRVEFQEIEGTAERARCDVDRGIIDFGVYWHLSAVTTQGADAHCGARCFR